MVLVWIAGSPGRAAGGPVVRALRASSVLAGAVTVAAIALMVVGLALSARPEMAEGFGLVLASRDGLALALVGGAVAIAFAVLGRVLSLLRDNLADDGIG